MTAHMPFAPGMDGQTTVAVVDPDETARGELMELVKEIDDAPVSYEDLDTFWLRWGHPQPVVVVVGPTQMPEELIPRVRQLLLDKPAVAVVLVVFDLTSGVLQQALRAGIDDVVAVSAEDEELGEAVSRASARLLAPKVALASAPVQPPAVDEQPRKEGKVVTVFCTKGGVGKSVVAVNLAVALAQSSPGPVVLVDADMQFGDVALMLRLQPSHTISEALAAGDRIDGSLLDRLMLVHEPSGLRVLAAPTEPGPADHIHREDLTRVLSVLRSECDYVVVDTSANFGEITLGAVQAADDIVLVAGLDVMSLRSAKVGLETMRLLGVFFSKVTFVLNRANTQVGLTNHDAERVLQLKVNVALPSDLIVAASVNKGEPVVTSSPRSKFAHGIAELAAKLHRVAVDPD